MTARGPARETVAPTLGGVTTTAALPALKLGTLGVDPAVVLAPMAGITNPFDEPAEVLGLFGPQGERLHVRARPAPAVSRA